MIGLGLLAAGAIGAAATATLGLYNVAASRGHWAITDHALRFGMVRSVKAHADDAPAPAPALDDDLARLGAGHYAGGCAYCHGAPGEPISPIAASMLPPPPDLRLRVDEWSDQQLHWLVQHGLKYAGMPAWPAPERADETWALVAFLRRLPHLDAEGYQRMAGGEARRERADARAIAHGRSDAGGLDACARCHGDEDGPTSTATPILHGQPREALLRALQDYAYGRRRSGFMQPAAVALSDVERDRLSAFYAQKTPPARREPVAAAALLERGRTLHRQGDPSGVTPACVTCHGDQARADMMRLDGQHARYLALRLKDWRTRKAWLSPQDAIMGPIARSLSDVDIEALAAFYDSRR
jgi:cytochrome c553